MAHRRKHGSDDEDNERDNDEEENNNNNDNNDNDNDNDDEPDNKRRLDISRLRWECREGLRKLARLEEPSRAQTAEKLCAEGDAAFKVNTPLGRPTKDPAAREEALRYLENHRQAIEDAIEGKPDVKAKIAAVLSKLKEIRKNNPHQFEMHSFTAFVKQEFGLVNEKKSDK